MASKAPGREPQGHGWRRDLRAVTLLEVLVVIATVALLLAALLPSVRGARAQAHRVVCQSNQRQILLAMHYYADDHGDEWFTFNHKYDFERGQYTGITFSEGEPVRWEQTVDGNSVVALAMKPGSYRSASGDRPSTAEPSVYVPDWNVLTCPATVNRITRPEHLNDVVADRMVRNSDERQAGHSYSYLMGFEKVVDGPRGKPIPDVEAQYDHEPHDGLPDCLKSPRTIVNRASKIILLADGDNRVTGGDGGVDLVNCPDNPSDNHGVAGWNVGFADGHVSWLNRTETFWALYASGMRGQWTPGQSNPETDLPPVE